MLEYHLADTYGIDVVGTEELDERTVRIDRGDGPTWVARLIDGAEHARGDAATLDALDRHGFPAERLAAEQPVSEYGGQAVLVTEFVPPVPRAQRREAIVRAGGLRALGDLQGRLHAHPTTVTRPGGAWHHLAYGAPSAELDALRELAGGDSKLLAAVDGLSDGAGLPEALIHPDFVMANVVASRDGGMVLVDWSGTGRGPRAWALAFTLWSVGFNDDLARVDRLAAGYARHVRLEPSELDALPGLIRVRPTVFTVWSIATGRRPAARLDAELRRIDALAATIGERAQAALSDAR